MPPKKHSTTQGAFLTDIQRRILEIIDDFVYARGYPPSIREICQRCSLQSTSSAAYQVKQLERKGYIQRDPNTPRALKIVRDYPNRKTAKNIRDKNQRQDAPTCAAVPLPAGETAQAVSLPVFTYGTVPSRLNMANFTGERFPIAPQLLEGLNTTTLFVIRMPDQSMTEAGLKKNDYLLASTTGDNQTDGVILVMATPGALVVRTLNHNASGPILESQIPPSLLTVYPPLRVQRDQIIGIVIANLSPQPIAPFQKTPAS